MRDSGSGLRRDLGEAGLVGEALGHEPLPGPGQGSGPDAIAQAPRPVAGGAAQGLAREIGGRFGAPSAIEALEPAGRVSRLPSLAGLVHTFSSLGDRNYLFLWTGMLLQMAGMQVMQMANGFYMYELTGSATRLGIVTAASAVPGLALTFFGGALADRLEKKQLIQVGQFLFMLVALFIAVSITTRTVTWQHLLGASFLMGLIMPFLMPARQAIIPQVVKRERLMNAVALNSLGMSLTGMLAPVAAGLFIALVSIEGLYYAIAGMYAAAVLFTGLLPKYRVEASGPKRTILADIGQGVRYMRDNTVLISLLVMGLVFMMLAMPLRFILPVFAKDIFQVGPSGLGVMMSAMGIGGLGGALFIASLGKVGRRGLLLGTTGILLGAVVIGFATISSVAPLFPLALGFLVVMGLVQSGQMAMQQSMTMEYVDPAYRGRVMSFNGVGWSLMPAAVLPLSVATDAVGAPVALGAMAVILLMVGILVLIKSPRLRALR